MFGSIGLPELLALFFVALVLASWFGRSRPER